MATVRDIAKIAGVSIGTVSKALHDNPCLRPEMRARVKQIAEELGYFPNRLARAVLTKQSSAIGLFLPEIARPYFACTLSGIVEEANKADYHVIVREYRYQADLLKLALTFFIEHRVEGIIGAPAYLSPVLQDSLTLLRGQGIAVVSLDDHPEHAKNDNVVTDQRQLAEMAVEYLVGLGHRHIALVGGMPNVPFHVTLGHAVLEALRRRHLPPLHYGNQPTEAFTDAFTAEMLQAIRADRPSPTALICWTERQATRVIQSAAAFGLRIPDDLSILACTDSLICENSTPTITSIEMHPVEKGRAAVRLLLRNIAERDLPHRQPEHCIVPCRLTVRNSCRKPGAW
ncbi:MAG: LacI family DNA-binding transcriptional regulator [Armatimonadota bacterium]